MSLFNFGKKTEDTNENGKEEDISRYIKKPTVSETSKKIQKEKDSEFDDLSNKNQFFGNISTYDNLEGTSSNSFKNNETGEKIAKQDLSNSVDDVEDDILDSVPLKELDSKIGSDINQVSNNTVKDNAVKNKLADLDDDDDEFDDISFPDLDDIDFPDDINSVDLAASKINMGNNSISNKAAAETADISRVSKGAPLQEKTKIMEDVVFQKEVDLGPAIKNVIKADSARVEANETKSKTDNEPSENKEYSAIMALAITRPIEVAYDLTDIYQKEPVEKVDIFSTNKDLEDLINSKPKIKYLDVSDCELITNYSSIANLTELEELDISGSPALTDLSFLNGLKKLRVLNIGNCAIESLSNFPSLPSLQVLNLKMNKIKNLDGLEGCTGLHDLILWGCTNIDNIDAASNFKELRMLDIDSCNILKDISAISNLHKLVYLNLNFTRIENLSPIKDLTNLEIFTMDFCPMAISKQNLSYFEKLTKLKFLALRNRFVTTLEYFRNMTEMVELELSGNSIQDLTPLENMVNLQILNLSTNPSLTDLSPLHKMKKLKKLMVSGAKDGKTVLIWMLIEDISIVKELPSLEVFESNCNKKIKDISPLQYCKNLQEVYFSDCLGIADITPLRFCKNLKVINVENCTQIKNISFVKYLTQLCGINFAKTSVEKIVMSNWTRSYDIGDLKDGGATLFIHKAIIDSIKFRKKISKIAQKTIKNDTNN